MRRKETETTPLFRRVPTSALDGETRLGRSGRDPRLGKGWIRARCRGGGRPGRGCAGGEEGRGGEEWQLKGALGDGTVEGVGRV